MFPALHADVLSFRRFPVGASAHVGPMLIFYATIFVALVVETFVTVMFGLSAEMERSIARRQSNWDRDMTRAYLNLTLRVAFRFALGILIAVRIVQLSG